MYIKKNVEKMFVLNPGNCPHFKLCMLPIISLSSINDNRNFFSFLENRGVVNLQYCVNFSSQQSDLVICVRVFQTLFRDRVL